MMNMLDVHAIGWIVARDVFWESFRAHLGLQPRLGRGQLEDLAEAWRHVERAVHEDEQAMGYIQGVFLARTADLSDRSEQAMRRFVHKLLTLSPRLYAVRVLRDRSIGACAQVVACLLCCALAAYQASPESSTPEGIALVFLAIASWYMGATCQLIVAYKLVRRLAPDDGAGDGHHGGWHLPPWRDRR
jgi:hypothetical protein